MLLSQSHSRLLRSSVTIGICLLVVATGASAETYRIELSGWGMPSQEADADGSMGNGTEATVFGKGAFGGTVNHYVIDFADWDGSSFCDFDAETGVPGGALLYVIRHSNILRTESGDLLYRNMANSPPSTICFNFSTGQSSSTIYLDIMGGTGRFRGATGSSVYINAVFPQDGQNATEGHEEGHIHLAPQER